MTAIARSTETGSAAGAALGERRPHPRGKSVANARDAVAHLLRRSSRSPTRYGTSSCGRRRARAVEPGAFQYNGGATWIMFYMVVVAVQSMNQTFRFAVGFSSTRRDYYLGTGRALRGSLRILRDWGSPCSRPSKALTGGWGVDGAFFAPCVPGAASPSSGGLHLFRDAAVHVLPWRCRRKRVGALGSERHSRVLWLRRVVVVAGPRVARHERRTHGARLARSSRQLGARDLHVDAADHGRSARSWAMR